MQSAISGLRQVQQGHPCIISATRFGVRPALPLQLAPSSSGRSPQRMARRVMASGDFKDKFGGLLGTGSKVADSLASIIPESVPRPVAKAGVVGVVGLVGFWLVQKVISTVLFLAVLGGGAYLWYRISENSEKDDGPGGSGGNEALSEAQRIMQKYK